MARRKIGYEEFRQEFILNKQNKTSTHVILHWVLLTLAIFLSFIPPANMCPQCQSGAKELRRRGIHRREHTKRVDHVPYLLIFLHVRDIKREE